MISALAMACVLSLGQVAEKTTASDELATKVRSLVGKEGLGHEVKDEDVMSISAWMKADDKVVDSVIHDDSREHSVEDAMENCFSKYTDRHDRSSQ